MLAGMTTLAYDRRGDTAKDSDMTNHRTRRSGFTLIEVLTVIGIIVILASIAIPVTMRARKQSEAKQMAMNLQTISVALDQYKTDHGDYPRLMERDASDDFEGARLLCRSLVAPAEASYSDGGGDGNNGPGFRTRRMPGPDNTLDTADDVTQGQVHGPYVKADSFKLDDNEVEDDGTPDLRNAMLLDGNGKPILYYAALPVKPNLAVAFVGPPTTTFRPLYDSTQNRKIDAGKLALMLGDADASGAIDAGETAATTGPFLLWVAGSDKEYGPTGEEADPSTTVNAADVPACDDITNFNKQ